MKTHRSDCLICKNHFSRNELTPLSMVRDSIIDLIKVNFPINGTEYICREDLNSFRRKYFEKVIQEDRGELNEIEKTVLIALQERETISKRLQKDEGSLTLGEKVSDKIAEFGGSWTFILGFVFFLSLWILWNTSSPKIFDPYPYILLNLFLSMIAALQAPIIMMSQNRQAARDRRQQEEDFKVNLKAEIDIRMINEKMDKLITHQWQRLLEIQEMQIEIMNQTKK